jgi:hypothetical protein
MVLNMIITRSKDRLSIHINSTVKTEIDVLVNVLTQNKIPFVNSQHLNICIRSEYWPDTIACIKEMHDAVLFVNIAAIRFERTQETDK